MDNIEVENLIIGAGPGGVQLAYCFGKLGIPYLIVEKGPKAGAFYDAFPRHRKLISINKIHTGNCTPEVALRWDWNSLLTEEQRPLFKEFDKKYFPDASSLVQYINEFAEHHDIEPRYDTAVEKIERDDKGFVAVCSNGLTVRAIRVFVATGYSVERRLDFEGWEHVVPYSEVETAPEQFRDKRVLIIGKGNSAFETGENLVEVASAIHLVSPTPLRLAWKTHYVGDLRAVNNNLLDTYHLKSQNSVQNAEIICVRKDKDGLRVLLRYTKTQGETREIVVDHVIACVGFKFDVRIFGASCLIETVYDGKFPKLTPEWESVSTPGVFFCGAIMHSNDFRRSFSGFIHGFRYNVRALSQMIARRHYGVKWPQRKVAGNASAVAALILRELEQCSSLFQLPGFLSYLFGVTRDASGQITSVTHMTREMPMAYADFASLLPQGEESLKVTLEFGKSEKPDPFDTNDDPNESYLFLHPVIRRCLGEQVLDELHLRQDLEHQWGFKENLARFSQWLDEAEVHA